MILYYLKKSVSTFLEFPRMSILGKCLLLFKKLYQHSRSTKHVFLILAHGLWCKVGKMFAILAIAFSRPRHREKLSLRARAKAAHPSDIIADIPSISVNYTVKGSTGCRRAPLRPNETRARGVVPLQF